MITVQIAYAAEQHIHIKTVHIGEHDSVGNAISRSGILQCCPEIDLEKNRVGIFGRICSLDSIPTAGDRIEIYRPLALDPKEQRRIRAARKH